MKPRTALITGISGYVGCALASHLLKQGWSVHGVVRPKHRPFPLEDVQSQAILHLDDGTSESLDRAVSKSAPDVVFHLATLFLAAHKPEEIPALIESNVTFGARLLEAMTKQKCFSLVNTGTCWQNFEGANYRPVALYAATKQAFETVVAYYVDVFPLKAVTLKIFDTIGPKDPRGKLYGLFKTMIESGNHPGLDLSDGEQLVAPLYIEDAVEALTLAAERVLDRKEPGHESFGIPGEAASLKTIAGIFERISGVKLPLRWGIRPNRPREMRGQIWNAGPALPGWKPKYSLEQGIEKFLKS